MPINDLITIRKGSSTDWALSNPVLASGEPGYDTTNNILKIGNGSSTWSSLSPIGSGGSGSQNISNYGSNRILVSDGTSTGINALTDLVFYSENSKLGIGTTNPNGNLSLSNGSFSVDGDSQYSSFTARNTTTNNSETFLYLDGASSKIVLPPKSVWNFTINVSCYSSTNDGAGSWTFRGCCKRTLSTTALVGSLIEENFIDTNLNGINCTVTANSTDYSLDIKVYGLNSNTIRWSAAINFIQTTFISQNYFLPMKYNNQVP